MIYCCGLSPLLYVAASAELKQDGVTLISHINQEDLGRYEIGNPGITSYWASFICNEALIDLRDHLVLKCKVMAKHLSNPQVPFYELPNLNLDGIVTLTDNLLGPWLRLIKANKLAINVIQHGTSMLNLIPALRSNAYSPTGYFRAIRDVFFRYKLRHIFVFNGINQQFVDLIPWYLKRKFRIIDYSDYSSLCATLAKKLIIQDRIMADIAAINGKITMYFPNDELPDHEYESFLRKQLVEYPFLRDSTFVIKNHPRDPRDYRKYFDELGLRHLSLHDVKWRFLPAEIILAANPEFRYFGTLSITMTAIDVAKCYVSLPCGPEIRGFLKKEYSVLIKSMNKRNASISCPSLWEYL